MSVEPFAPGFLTEPSQPLDKIRLRGITCQACSVTLFGVRARCENCGSRDVTEVEFGRSGTLYSYTVQRHPPTPPFEVGPTDEDEWEPRPVGYVDLPEGARILSVVDAAPGDLSIGMQLELVIESGWTDDDGNDVLWYQFQPEVDR